MFLNTLNNLYTEDGNNLVEVKQLYLFNMREYENNFHHPCINFFKNPNKNFILYKNLDKIKNLSVINCIKLFSNNIVTVFKPKKIFIDSLEKLYNIANKENEDFSDEIFEYIRHCLDDVTEYDKYLDGNRNIKYKNYPMEDIVKILRYASYIESFVENTMEDNVKYLKNLLNNSNENYKKQKEIEDRKRRRAERRKHGKFIKFIDFLGDPVQYAQDEWS